MSAEWQQVSLGDLFKVKHGFAFKGEFFTEKPQRHVLVTPGNFAIGGGFQNAKQKYYCGPIPEDYVLKPGQVVVTMTDLSKQSDTLGYAALVPDDNTAWLHNQRVGLLEFFGKIEADPIFVSYLLRTHEYRSWVVGSATGTTVKHTSPSRIEAYKCKIPPIHEQQNIANTLGSIDNKIDLNRRINQTLEAMAQAIFKSWFVDFDPVKAKIAAKQQGHDPLRAAMCVISGKTDGELDQLPREHFDSLAATAALFPDELADSALGEIPKGWRYKSAEEIAEIGIGKTPPRKEPQWFTDGEGDYRWLSIRDMGLSGVFQQKTSEYLTAEAVSRFNVRVVPDHTVVLSFKLTVGRVSITDGVMVTNEAIAHFKLAEDAPLTTEYLYLCLKDFDYASLGSTSSIADAVNSKTIRDMKLLIPAEAVGGAFRTKVSPLFLEMKARQSEIETLSNLRDGLLPKLMSGEVEVSI